MKTNQKISRARADLELVAWAFRPSKIARIEEILATAEHLLAGGDSEGFDALVAEAEELIGVA